MKPIFQLLTACLLYLPAYGQLQKVKTLNIKNTSVASVDRLGNFYFVIPSGKIQKYDGEGTLLGETLSSALPLSLLEPWNPLKVFTYSNQTRKYQFWDHHLERLADKTLEPSFSITPQLVCPANENNKAWILDVADYSLKRVNLLTNQIELESTLPSDWGNDHSKIIFMREYQNRVFLLDQQKGILMLNNLGIPITTIKIVGLTFFNFVGQELCYRNGKEILLLDLFTGDIRKVATLPDIENIIETILTDERLVVVTRDNIKIYRVTE
jgi:hypothetical protein